MSKRINIVLPETTIQAIDRVANPGKRSLFIDQAVQHFISHRSREALRTQLEQAAVRDRDLDREIAADSVRCGQRIMANTSHPRTEKDRNPRRGEIYLTALDPTVGREIRKTRPALIIQNDVSNRLSESPSWRRSLRRSVFR